MKRGTTGFTLIELLVVISIISLLSSVVLSALNSARTKANTARARQEMYQFAKITAIAQGEAGKTLMTITGNNCSYCVCSGDLRNTSGSCYTQWVTAITNLQSNTNGIATGLIRMTRDPWGSPYLLDENQGESGICTNADLIKSAGPDGTNNTADDIASPVAIPFSAICP